MPWEWVEEMVVIDNHPRNTEPEEYPVEERVMMMETDPGKEEGTRDPRHQQN